MERQEYMLLDIAQTLLQSWVEATSTDTVTITIYDVDDAATDVSAAAMTFVSGVTWKYSWTPTQTNNYIITFYNATLNISFYLYVKVVGTLVGVPGGSGTGSTLTNLRSRFLRIIDNYNSDDLSGTNSSGDVADLYINEALQVIYADIKNSRYLDAYSSISLATVADQAYIELSGISDLDDLFAIKDTTNDFTLVEIPKWRYFMEVPDPANSTGTPYRYTRIFNRIYLDPRPTSVITYTTEYKKTYARLTNGSDTALIPSKYDKWIYDEAWIMWLRGEDPSNVGAIQVAIDERERTRDIFLSDIGSQFARASQMRSQFGARGYTNYWRGIGQYD